MKFFVTGVGGQLGHDVMNELLKRGHEGVGSDIQETYSGVADGSAVTKAPYVALDITDKDAVEKVITEVNPDAVIHCAAWTAVDMAEDDDKVAKVRAINAGGTQNIADVCKKLDCKMTYISTDYVFDGQGTEPWKPDCKDYKPLNVYGQTKLEGELAVSQTLEKYFIVRIAWVFGLNGKNFIKTMGVVIPSTILTLLMAVGFSTPAFAYVDTTELAEEPAQVIEEAEPTDEEKIPFTIAGNGEVEDNIVDDPSKEFFTVKTKGGNTFFLVIDRARNSENVYMLSMIDEYDLQEFLDDEERNGKQEEETPAVVLPETKPEPTPDVEIEEPKEESSGGMNKILLLVFVAALGGAGAFFYFYIYKPKPKEETPQSENLETDQSLATVNEDNQSGNENGT